MADGATVDTSSYPKGQLPVSPLDLAGKLGGLQQQKLGIDQVKLDQANQALTYMTRAMGSLGPDATKEQYAAVGQNAVDQGLVPQNTLNIYTQRLEAAPDAKSFYNEFMTAAAGHQEQINYHLGQRQDVANGQTVTPAVTSVKPGFGVRPVGLPVQQQAPPTATVVDENNQPRMLGAQPTQLPPGTAPAGNLPGQFRAPLALPAVRPVSGPTGPTVDRTAETPTNFDNRFPQPRGAAAGTSPLFEEGKKSYTEDQLSASARSQAIKPAIDALKLMPGMSSGPGTEQLNTAIAALKAFGVTDIKETDDPTAIRQEVNKKLAQYVGNNPNVSRSDASQALAEAGSPNAKTQILPALMKLTRDAVALDRVKILQPQAFEGKNYQDYVKHQGNFPNTIDQKALTLDLLPEKEREDLVKKMANQYKNGNAAEKRTANKFLDTFTLATKKGIYE